MIRGLSLFVRLLAIALVAISPWLPATTRPSRARAVVYVVDRSASIGAEGLEVANRYLGEAWAARGEAQLGVVAFDGRVDLITPLGASKAPIVDEGAEPTASDLAGAVRLAAAALPLEGHRSIVLLTDARATRGDAAAEVRRAAERGIRVDVVPIDGPSPELPIVTAVRARASHVAEHQPVALDVDVRAEQPFRLEWTRDGVRLPPQVEYMRKDNQDRTVALLDPSPPPGVHVYAVKASAWTGRRPHEASVAPPVLTAVSVEGKAHAVVFSSTGDVPPVLKSALAESALEARMLPIDRAADPASFSGADLVVLADVRVSGAASDDTGLTRAAQIALVDYVQQGGGLLVTGGVFGLAPEYAGTPLARAIPVEIEDRGHVEDPPVTLAIMLDRSGSMSAPVGAHTKIELAIEASIAAADTLRPTDQIAIGSVDTQTNWNVELGPQSRLAELRSTVRSVTAGGGGIYVYTALKDAYAAIERSAKTPVRHVILFSDTADSEQQSEDCPFDNGCAGKKTAEQLAREARVKGITTTVVGIGEESAKDTAFLRRLATASGGRFYLTSEGADLRRIFLSETRVLAQSNLREKKTSVAAAGTHPALEGVDAAKLPELAAYVETGRRSGADTALLLSEGRPMLATWRYGLGKAGAIATDLSEGWGAAWAASPEAAKVLRQTLRFLLRQNDARRADASVRIRDRMVEVDIELPPDAPDSAAPASLDVWAVSSSEKEAQGSAAREGPASRKLTMRLEQRGPGRWTARGRSSGESIAIVRARDARGALMAEAVGGEDRALELSGSGADSYVVAELARIGEGRVGPMPSSTMLPTKSPARELAATWPYALLLAAFLVVIDLILRRFGEPRRAPFAIVLGEKPVLRAAA